MRVREKERMCVCVCARVCVYERECIHVKKDSCIKLRTNRTKHNHDSELQPDLESSLMVIGGHAGVAVPAHVHGGVGPVLDWFLWHSLILAGTSTIDVLCGACSKKSSMSSPRLASDGPLLQHSHTSNSTKDTLQSFAKV